MSFDLCIWDKCNNRCLQCTNPDRPWPAFDGSFAYDYESIIARLRAKQEKIKQSDSIYITGGEPTIHPRFLDILDFLKNNFPEQTIKILSNGRACAYEKYAKNILEASEILEIDVSLYGPDEKTHDGVTQAVGSFAQTSAGLKNLLKHKRDKQIIGLRFVLTKKSYKKISEFLDLAIREFSGIDRLIIIFPEYEAQALKNQAEIMIKYSDVEAQIDSAFAKIKELDKKTQIRFYHFPLCTLDKNFWPYAGKTWPKSEVEFLPQCSECKVRKYCVGPHKGYIKNVGGGEFMATQGEIKIEESRDKYRPILKVDSNK